MGVIRGTIGLLLGLLFSMVFLAVGVLFGIQAYYAMTCKDWPVTNGTVVAYRQTPVYRFQVGGLTNESDVVSCNELLNSDEAIRNSEKYSVRYPLGAAVVVHYNPHKAKIAVLETQFNRQYLIPIGASILVGLILFLASVKVWTDRLLAG